MFGIPSVHIDGLTGGGLYKCVVLLEFEGFPFKSFALFPFYITFKLIDVNCYYFLSVVLAGKETEGNSNFTVENYNLSLKMFRNHF